MQRAVLPKGVTKGTRLRLNTAALRTAYAEKQRGLQLDLPNSDGSITTLNLVKMDITSENFATAITTQLCTAYSGGVHYRGIVAGKPNSLAAISIFGDAVMGLFADEKTFMKEPIVSKLVKAVQGETKAVFENVPPGTYALSIIHDSNENGELDSNFFGMPKEGFGFSNDVMGTFGPPSFQKASFTISTSMVLTVHTKYL